MCTRRIEQAPVGLAVDISTGLARERDAAGMALGIAPQLIAAGGHGGLDGFRRGLAQTVEWFRDPAHLERYRSDVYNL